MRDDVVPSAIAGKGVTVDVGGATAGFVDQSDLVARRLPLFIAGVVGLSFLLLLSAFRSPLIALKAGVMNLLSVGAAYGVMALFASGGWFGSLLGIDTATPVAPFIPVMMFAILFGLSMDYEVFLLSRVREEYLRHGDTGRAVTEGLARTARVITAAAAVMVVVFLAFVTSGEIFLKLLGDRDGDGGPRRCDRGADGARPGADAAARARQLVDAAVAGSRRAPARTRGGMSEGAGSGVNIASCPRSPDKLNRTVRPTVAATCCARSRRRRRP